MRSTTNTLMNKRPNLGTIKYKLVKHILYLNEVAIEVFGIEKLEKEELYQMKISDLKNIKTELIIQLGIKHKFNFGRARIL